MTCPSAAAYSVPESPGPASPLPPSHVTSGGDPVQVSEVASHVHVIATSHLTAESAQAGTWRSHVAPWVGVTQLGRRATQLGTASSQWEVLSHVQMG